MEKINSREEILRMELTEAYQTIRQLARMNERQEAIRKWDEYKRKTISGDNLPQMYDDKGKAIPKKPTDDGIARRLRNALDL